ncbi:BtrH N-terminal domain-containing protein [Streptomyces sp. NPDC003860]
MGNATDQTGEFTSLDCITATYGNVLELLGHDPSVLGEDWGYHPANFPDTEWPVEDLTIHRRPPEDIIRDWYGLETEFHQHRRTADTADYLREKLGRGEPVIVLVDAFHLPHSSNHRLQHHAHRITVRSLAGGADDGTYAIVDRYRGSLFDGAIDARDLLSAMASPALAEGRRGDPDWRLRTLGVSAAPTTAPRPAYADSVRRALARNTAPSAAASATTALRTCAARLRATPQEYASLSPAGLIEVSAWFGELASQRALNARFLHTAADACALPSLTAHAATAQALSHHWEKARNYFYLRFRKGVPAVLRLSDFLDEAANREAEWNASVRRSLK